MHADMLCSATWKTCATFDRGGKAERRAAIRTFGECCGVRRESVAPSRKHTERKGDLEIGSALHGKQCYERPEPRSDVQAVAQNERMTASVTAWNRQVGVGAMPR
jgi:hypothetical protein